MAVTEKQRHDLFTRIEETLGPEHATTMMELLPPVGWADVATKRDLDAVADRLEARLGTKFATWLFAAMGVQTAVLGLVIGLTH